MEYKKYLEEEIKQVSLELQKSFNKALKEVFSERYLNEISKKLKDFIDIVEVDEKKGVIAYNVGSKIYINKNEFYNNDINQQARYLLHEFIHILQRRKGFLASKFKDIRILTIRIYDILKKHLKQPISVFLTGKNQNLGSGGKWETLSYFMNNSIDWSAVSDEGKRLIISEIKRSNIFSTNSAFWKKRLPQ